MKKSKAKIFISCGQKTPTEIKVVKKIETKLRKLGFETYLACEQHSLRGLKENIFSNLEDSEYFLFIDFKREKIGGNGFRGSLYTNQELAIAVYLDKKALAFQQHGITRLGGMLSSVQLNPVIFGNEADLSEEIIDKIKKAGWDNHWKDKLEIELEKNYDDVEKIDKKHGRHYYLKVRNLNRKRTAFNCTAYVKSIFDETNNKFIDSETVEVKWAGSKVPSVTIMPGQYRMLDAFYLMHDEPSRIRFMSYSDSKRHLPPLDSNGKYRIEYTVVSANYPLAEIITHIQANGDINKILWE